MGENILTGRGEQAGLQSPQSAALTAPLSKGSLEKKTEALSLEDYIRLIPKEPPEDIYEIARANDARFRVGVLSYKAISFAEAEGLGWRDDVVDFRRDNKERPAEMWCSQCNRKMIGRYVSAKSGCHGYAGNSGVEILDNYYQSSGVYEDGTELLCPCCGEEVKLRSANAMRYGIGAETIITQCTVAEGKVIFTEWLVERHIIGTRELTWADGMRAYILDGKKWVKLVKYRRNMGRMTMLRGWEKLSRMTDELGAPILYPAEPCLDGTELENAKLWEYKAQSYKQGYFLPIVYSRLYLKHRNIENLITAGFGKMAGECLQEEARFGGGYYGDYKFKTAKMEWVNWKKCKPTEMLGLTKEELRTARDRDWDGEDIRLYTANKDHVSLTEFETAVGKMRLYTLKNILEEPINRGQLGKIMRYMEKQRETDYYIYIDYIGLAREQRLDMTDASVRWPPRLRDAHDRLAIANRYRTKPEVAKNFAKMTERCRGLNWKQGNICIRVAETPEELVQEGATLHHCVGGYAENHARGNIILFIRHARRPERSWFTLNLNTAEKIIIQNHGYRNERLANGKMLKIPREVKAFVESWQENVLTGWELPVAR